MNDLRLVPAAVLTWLACAVGVGWTSRTLLVLAGGVVSVAVVAAVVGRGGPADDRGRVAVTAWLAMVAVAVGLVSCAAQVRLRDGGLLPALVADRATVVLVGTVRSEAVPVASTWPGDEPGIRFVVAAAQVTGRGGSGDVAAQVLVLAGVQDVRYGSRIRVTGRLAPAARGDDVRGVLRASGPVTTVRPPGGLDAVVGRVRRGLLEVTDPLPADLRGLVPGAAIGDTTRLPADLDRAMQDVGLTHITAVSGGHFAVLSVTVLALTAALGLPGWARAAVTALAMTGFVLLVHPDPSVVRAAAMGAVAVVGMLLGRPARTVPALGAAVVVLLVVDPWLARSYGFVLSVLATGALALLAPAIAARLPVLPRWLAVAVAVPIAAQAVCGPVLVLLDPAVSVYAVPANLLAAPALLPATVLGVTATLAAPWAPGLAEMLARGAGAAAWWIAEVARACAGLPGARHDWPSGPAGALALVVATVAVLGIVPALRRWGLRAGVVVVVLVVSVSVLPGARGLLHDWPPRGWRVVACDVGQGDALVVRSGPGAAVVVDVGPEGSAADRCLDALGVTRIDLLVLTHYHADHVGGLADVLDGRQVDRALVSPLARPAGDARRTLAALEAAGVPVRVAVADGIDSAGDAGEVAWTVLSPASARPVLGSAEPGGSEINDASLVLVLRAPDLAVLALGDAEVSAQERLVGVLADLPAIGVLDVVKVAHHGSASQSERLIELTAPSVALVSVGDNDYGHPAERTIAAYRAVGSLVLSTRECGPVAVGREPGGGGLEVSARCLAGRG